MGRKKGDGFGKFGGRRKGTPNKNNPIKTYLRNHSVDYFMTDERTGRSQFDNDIEQLEPSARVNAELALLNYTTPKMQAVAIDATVTDAQDLTIEQRIAQLAANYTQPQ